MDVKLNNSLWEQDVFFEAQHVIIIGGGIVGMSTALSLIEKEPGLRISILERGPIPTGASTRNAGFACFGSVSELMSDAALMDEEDIKTLITLRVNGLKRLRHVVPDQHMDYTQCGGYEYFHSPDKSYHECIDQIQYYNSLVLEATGLTDTFSSVSRKDFGFSSSLPFIFNRHEGQLHPAKMIQYMRQLLIEKGVKIFNGAEVNSIEEDELNITVQLMTGHVLETEQLILTTNAFTSKLNPVEDVQAVRNQVFVTQAIPNLKFKACFHCEEGYVYFRNVGNRILIGGARQHFSTEDTGSFGQTSDVKNYLHNFVVQELGVSSQIKFEYSWSGILAVGSTKMPIVRRISQRKLLGVRMGGMGVAIGSKVGQDLANLTLS